MTKPLRFIFRPKESASEEEIFSTNPENVVLLSSPQIIFCERTLVGDSVRMVLVGIDSRLEREFYGPLDCGPVKRYFILTFDRFHNFDVDLEKVDIRVMDPAFHIKIFENDSTDFVDCRLHYLKNKGNHFSYKIFTVTDEKGLSVSAPPSLCLMPGKFISKDGIPVETEAMEIYHMDGNDNINSLSTYYLIFKR